MKRLNRVEPVHIAEVLASLGLPAVCPECHHALDPEFSQRIRPCRFGRGLQVTAWITVPIMFIFMIAHMAYIGGFPFIASGPGAGWAFLGFIAGPAMLLYVISLFLPRVRRFTCLACGWQKNLPIKPGSPQPRGFTPKERNDNL